MSKMDDVIRKAAGRNRIAVESKNEPHPFDVALRKAVEGARQRKRRQ